MKSYTTHCVICRAPMRTPMENKISFCDRCAHEHLKVEVKPQQGDPKEEQGGIDSNNK